MQIKGGCRKRLLKLISLKNIIFSINIRFTTASAYLIIYFIRCIFFTSLDAPDSTW